MNQTVLVDWLEEILVIPCNILFYTTYFLFNSFSDNKVFSKHIVASVKFLAADINWSGRKLSTVYLFMNQTNLFIFLFWASVRCLKFKLNWSVWNITILNIILTPNLFVIVNQICDEIFQSSWESCDFKWQKRGIG